MIKKRLQLCLFVTLLLRLGLDPAYARHVEITILHTTDIHGHILPTRDYEGNENVGGLLRCASAIESIRSQRENVMLIDCGDLFQGSAESYLTEGRIMTKALEWLHYDAWVIGNHEFDWGVEKLQALHDKTTLTMLAANIVPRPGRSNPLPKIQPFMVKDLDGVRVAVIGLTTPGIPSWSRPDLLGDAQFEGSVEALTRVMPLVRAQEPDITILAMHQGYRNFGDDHANEVNAVAHKFPELDAIIGGHSHRVIESARVGQVLYTQAGYYANWLGRLDLDYDTVQRRVVSNNAQVITIGDQYPRLAAMEDILKADTTQAEQYVIERVGSSTEKIPSAFNDTDRSPIQMLICRAMAETSGAEIVLHGILTDDPLPEGDISMDDVWRIVPYENRIGVALLTSQEISEILEENGSKHSSIHFMGAYGLTYQWKTDADGTAHVIDLRLADGSQPHPRKRLRVALSSYVMASGGARFPRLREIVDRPESRMELTNYDTRTAVLEYIRKHSPISVQALMQTTDPE